jgi:hypothetical protein
VILLKVGMWEVIRRPTNRLPDRLDYVLECHLKIKKDPDISPDLFIFIF